MSDRSKERIAEIIVAWIEVQLHMNDQFAGAPLPVQLHAVSTLKLQDELFSLVLESLKDDGHLPDPDSKEFKDALARWNLEAKRVIEEQADPPERCGIEVAVKRLLNLPGALPRKCNDDSDKPATEDPAPEEAEQVADPVGHEMTMDEFISGMVGEANKE